MAADNDFDVVIVGSGCGGSVTALRLIEKGYRVAVIAAGRGFAEPGGEARAQLPGDTFFGDERWAGITDWRAELEPYYERALTIPPRRYLTCAERGGARIVPMTMVMTVRPLRAGGWKVSAQRTGRPWWVGRRTFTAGQVVLAAGAHGTRRLLADMRDRGVLNHLSARLGEPTPTGGGRDAWGTHAGHAGPDGRETESAGHTALRHLVATVRSRTGAGTIGLPGTDRELGGCCIGGNPRDGVIDAYHRVFGYPSLSVVGAAAVTADPGVNPALTVCAQAERAAAFWPNVDEPDPRPGQGGVYRRIDAVRPDHPLDAAAAVQGKSDGAPRGTQPVQPRETPDRRPRGGAQTDESGRHRHGDEPSRNKQGDEPGAGGQDPSNS